jgi:beta-glucosidase
MPEPNIYALLGHCFGKHAPGRGSDRDISPEGNSYTEPFIVGHNLILSHATAVKVYREEFKQKQGGKIGLVVNMNWGGECRHAIVCSC